MGGFMAYEGNRPVRVLLPHGLRSYSLTGNGNFPRISKGEIEEKSKGDVISKGGRHPANELVRGIMHRSRSPRPTDHRTGARHGCVCSPQFRDILAVVGQAPERAMWGAGIQETWN